MARISGVDLPDNKRLDIALRTLYGIGPVNAVDVCKLASIDMNLKLKDLSQDQLNRIQKVIQENFTVEGDLKKIVTQNIRTLMDIGCYRGTRHKKSLPVRGQRTRTNARTRKGPVKTVGKR
ncbi:MAG: 30S ribosomal protein S13 [Caldisericia bacterium]|nr:30S ribosomal protein S13 [Caldisericia bacterium]